MKPMEITYHCSRNNSLFQQGEKYCLQGMHEYEKLYHAEMYLFRYFLSDNLCHPLFHLWNRGKYCKVTSPKQPTVIEICDFFFFLDVYVTSINDHGSYQLPTVWKLRSKLSYCRQYGI